MMDGNKLEELKELVEFLKANGIAEFETEHEGQKVRIKFAGEPAAAAWFGYGAAGAVDGFGGMRRLRVLRAGGCCACGGGGCCSG